MLVMQRMIDLQTVKISNNIFSISYLFIYFFRIKSLLSNPAYQLSRMSVRGSKYSEGEPVLCFQGLLIYEAKVGGEGSGGGAIMSFFQQPVDIIDVICTYR